MKTYLLLFCLLGISNVVLAQNGTITGRVVDQETSEALPYATVAAFQDDALVTGATTKDDGGFSLSLPYGTYRLVIQFLSYGNKQLEDITLNAQNPSLQLGDIVLASSEETLQAVEIQGEAVEMQMSLDKKIFNVQDNIATKGGTATDVLDNVPSVSVDTEGNVSLRGSDNVRILIDGRPSGLTGANALRQLPADLIERVEVITNPSARYEAQGMAGIINIVLKKERRNGLNGSVDVTTGWPHNHGLGVNLNIRRKAANFFVNAGTRYRINQGGGYADMTFSSLRDDELNSGYSFEYLIRNQERSHERGGWSNNLRVGSDFFLNQYNTLTASVLLRKSNSDNYSNLNYRFLRNAQEAVLSSVRNQHEDEKDQDMEGSLDYRRTFEEKNKVFSANVQYRINAEQEISDYTENYFLPGGAPINEAPEVQVSDTDETQKSFLDRK
ncbi:MAG: TonB-dependent receptor, partial [Bacteroidetes bacterium]|nr:TonB-dependent receptor [Bacteroidota bacterium]